MWVRGVETQCARKCCSCFSCSSLLAVRCNDSNLIKFNIFYFYFLHWCFTSDLVWRWPITSGPIKTLNAAKCSFVTHDSDKRKIMSGKGENCCRLLISCFIWLFCQVCLTHWMSQACFCVLLSALFHLLSQVVSIGDVTWHDRGSLDVSLHTYQTGLAEIIDQHNLRPTLFSKACVIPSWPAVNESLFVIFYI